MLEVVLILYFSVRALTSFGRSVLPYDEYCRKRRDVYEGRIRKYDSIPPNEQAGMRVGHLAYYVILTIIELLIVIALVNILWR